MQAPAPLQPPPRFEATAVDVPPPQIAIALATEPQAAITIRPEQNAASPAPVPAVEVPTAAPLRVSQVEYVQAPLPRYPALARKRRQQGTVIVEAIVDVDGRASAVEVRESSGYPLLDSAASEAVRKALFRPYVLNGVARAVSVLVPIEFGLGGRMASNGARHPPTAAR